MKYRMIALDIDGTLLDGSGRLPQQNRKAINRAAEAGVQIVLCTGRGLAETRHVIDDLEHHEPVVLACGAHVACGATGKTLHRRPIDPALAHELVHHFDHDRYAVLISPDPEAVDHDYMVVAGHNMTDNTRWWFDNINARVRHVETPSQEDLDHALRIAIVGPPDPMPAIQDSILKRFPQRVEVQHFAAIQQHNEVLHLLEVFAEGVNKWTALQWMAAARGIDDREIAAIGDQINDLQMIREAGCGVAMSNAADVVRAAADRTTDSNDAAGVARAIDRLLEGRW